VILVASPALPLTVLLLVLAVASLLSICRCISVSKCSRYNTLYTAILIHYTHTLSNVFQEISIGLLKEQQRNVDLLNSMLPASILTELNIRKTNGGVDGQVQYHTQYTPYSLYTILTIHHTHYTPYSQGRGDAPRMGIIAYSFDEVTVLFAKIDNFSTISNQLSPTELVKVLNTIYMHFDQLIDRHSVHKVL
jgi:hypothetical protein